MGVTPNILREIDSGVRHLAAGKKIAAAYKGAWV